MAIDQVDLPPAEQERILQERAKNLAREGPADQGARKQLDVVEFLLAYERYAIESHWVREVHPLKEITPLPGTPAFVLGIINVRGRIVSVVDLKAFFDLPVRGPGRPQSRHHHRQCRHGIRHPRRFGDARAPDPGR